MQHNEKMHMKCNWKRVQQFYLNINDNLKFNSVICKRREFLFSLHRYKYGGYEAMYNIFTGIHIKSPDWHLEIDLYDSEELYVKPYITIFTDVIEIDNFRRVYNLLNRYFFNPEYYKLFLFVRGGDGPKKFLKELLPLLKDFLCI